MELCWSYSSGKVVKQFRFQQISSTEQVNQVILASLLWLLLEFTCPMTFGVWGMILGPKHILIRFLDGAICRSNEINLPENDHAWAARPFMTKNCDYWKLGKIWILGPPSNWRVKQKLGREGIDFNSTAPGPILRRGIWGIKQGEHVNLDGLDQRCSLRYVSFNVHPHLGKWSTFTSICFQMHLKLSPSRPFVALDAFVVSLEVLYEQSIQGFGFRSKER